MAKVDPEALKQAEEGTVILEVKTPDGRLIGYKGRFIPDVYDNFTECLRENQNAHRIANLKKEGKNANAQTKEQEKAAEERKKLQQARKEKADVALLGAISSGAK